MRVSGAFHRCLRDSLTGVNVPRRCCRPGCPHNAVATLTFVYSDSTAVIGPLATAREPHSWDLCSGHAGRITAPRGWELVRHAGPLPEYPDEDDLIALADAVREGPTGTGAPRSGFVDPDTAVVRSHVGASGAGVLASPPVSNGRRRGHLRVLPDPAD